MNTILNSFFALVFTFENHNDNPVAPAKQISNIGSLTQLIPMTKYVVVIYESLKILSISIFMKIRGFTIFIYLLLYHFDLI